jgi:hypothetical protein
VPAVTSVVIPPTRILPTSPVIIPIEYVPSTVHTIVILPSTSKVIIPKTDVPTSVPPAVVTLIPTTTTPWVPPTPTHLPPQHIIPTSAVIVSPQFVPQSKCVFLIPSTSKVIVPPTVLPPNFPTT